MTAAIQAGPRCPCIEAAEVAGRLVYFEVFDADVEAPLIERQCRADRGFMGMTVARLPVLMIIALALGAVVLVELAAEWTLASTA